MILRTLIASAIVVSLAPAALADDPREQSIHIHEREMNDAERRAEIVRTIRRTARRVCDIHGARDLQTLRIERDCRRNAIDRAMLHIERRMAEIGTDLRRDVTG